MVQVISSNSEIKSKPNNGSDILALAEIGVLLNLERCDEIWCRISTQNIKGWVLRDNLFGILENELPN
jgi:SH3-like domain-containing protein